MYRRDAQENRASRRLYAGVPTTRCGASAPLMGFALLLLSIFFGSTHVSLALSAVNRGSKLLSAREWGASRFTSLSYTVQWSVIKGVLYCVLVLHAERSAGRRDTVVALARYFIPSLSHSSPPPLLLTWACPYRTREAPPLILSRDSDKS